MSTPELVLYFLLEQGQAESLQLAKDQIHLETYVEGEGSCGRSAVGEECYSDSKDTGCACLSLAPFKPAASLSCDVFRASSHMTVNLELLFKMKTLCGTTQKC